jgi:gas vesicle protein
MKSTNSNMSLFLSGLGAGVALAVLFAPKSGDETRASIKGALAGVKDKALEQSSNLMEGLKQRKTQVTAAVEAGQEAYRGAATRLSDELSSVS